MPEEDILKFQNHFWNAEYEKSDGFNRVTERLSSSKKGCKALAEFLRQRSQAEADFARALAKITRQCFVPLNEASLGRSWGSFLSATEHEAEYHLKLAKTFSDQQSQLHKFAAESQNSVKPTKTHVKKLEGEKKLNYEKQRRCKDDYHRKCDVVNALEYQLRVLQTQQGTPGNMTKVTKHLSKGQQTLGVMKKNYEFSVDQLANTRKHWEQEMDKALSTFQQTEEQRMSFIRQVLGTIAAAGLEAANNASKDYRISRECVDECSVQNDLRKFITEKQTGCERPVQIVFEEHATQLLAKQQQPQQQQQTRPPQPQLLKSGSLDLTLQQTPNHSSTTAATAPQLAKAVTVDGSSSSSTYVPHPDDNNSTAVTPTIMASNPDESMEHQDLEKTSSIETDVSSTPSSIVVPPARRRSTNSTSSRQQPKSYENGNNNNGSSPQPMLSVSKDSGLSSVHDESSTTNPTAHSVLQVPLPTRGHSTTAHSSVVVHLARQSAVEEPMTTTKKEEGTNPKTIGGDTDPKTIGDTDPKSIATADDEELADKRRSVEINNDVEDEKQHLHDDRDFEAKAHTGSGPFESAPVSPITKQSFPDIPLTPAEQATPQAPVQQQNPNESGGITTEEPPIQTEPPAATSTKSSSPVDDTGLKAAFAKDIQQQVDDEARDAHAPHEVDPPKTGSQNNSNAEDDSDDWVTVGNTTPMNDSSMTSSTSKKDFVLLAAVTAADDNEQQIQHEDEADNVDDEKESKNLKVTTQPTLVTTHAIVHISTSIKSDESSTSTCDQPPPLPATSPPISDPEDDVESHDDPPPVAAVTEYATILPPKPQLGSPPIDNQNLGDGVAAVIMSPSATPKIDSSESLVVNGASESTADVNQNKSSVNQPQIEKAPIHHSTPPTPSEEEDKDGVKVVIHHQKVVENNLPQPPAAETETESGLIQSEVVTVQLEQCAHYPTPAPPQQTQKNDADPSISEDTDVRL